MTNPPKIPSIAGGKRLKFLMVHFNQDIPIYLENNKKEWWKAKLRPYEVNKSITEVLCVMP